MFLLSLRDPKKPGGAFVAILPLGSQFIVSITEGPGAGVGRGLKAGALEGNKGRSLRVGGERSMGGDTSTGA